MTSIQAERILFVDTETTGFFSSDRVVSIGLISVDSASLASGQYEVKAAHNVFDPGKKSHPRAEEVHGYDDWTLRHQDNFATHAQGLRSLFDGSPLVVAHNVDFDRRFIEQEFAIAGCPLPPLSYYCTMKAYREQKGGRSGLNAVLGQMGLARTGKVHGAFEDAWLAMQVYLWMHGFPNSGMNVPHMPPTNFKAPPPRPDGPLPRRSKKRKALATAPRHVDIELPADVRAFATLLLYLARADGLVDSEIATLTSFLETDASTLGYQPVEKMDAVAAMMDLPSDSQSMKDAASAVAREDSMRPLIVPWLRSIANADGFLSDAERIAIADITAAFRNAPL
ncbi:MAG: hypothetical protein E5V37_04760 [Mesorhizobium sp.]|uniref:exonuclease domain-containing protein n=1 Tax=unclassified Mesorhizobium TaxID=325217 RepID=UPI000FCC727A|nr:MULTISPECIES: exonuclease domain-containing protein [unclassified Mesorhizobium]RUW40410.1 hypothetical protein EOA37_15015 [Mesorhizobium sp. M2A.F.Ca.ET.015.02.1.1]RWC81385.1 MAG: hypothetical protein EOS31_20610 [Mesorhizobium sp.]RWD74324.1 MAG: hypothetical protein EOS60_11315 [Mesorhizobium sp.]TIV86521.1 MAG: hypothetical protein E5V78_13620 [Mesorhizobium sp.]TIW17882.1 MAG: hypothetical protein E5V81_19190 [Mesorhizobium sp.]